MDEQTAAAKKTILRTIPYGLYVLGVNHAGEDSAACINWVTQTSFEPPLIVMGVKKDSGAYALLKKSGKFALSFLESGQKDLAFAFFKPTTVEGNHINGHEFERGAISSAPVLSSTPAFMVMGLMAQLVQAPCRRTRAMPSGVTSSSEISPPSASRKGRRSASASRMRAVTCSSSRRSMIRR